jgi:hypothetical protein
MGGIHMYKFRPSLMLDEQMIFHDTRNTLLYQIREELKMLNKNLESLNKPPEPEKETAVKKPIATKKTPLGKGEKK